MNQAEDHSHFPETQVPSICQLMMPRDTNALGTIFGGVILSQIDLAAAIEAHKSHPARVVTVSMDRIEFKAPVFVGDLVSFFTHTLRIGRTSIRVKVSVWAQRRFGGGERAYVTEAEVTMVAVDDQFRPVPVMHPTRVPQIAGATDASERPQAPTSDPRPGAAGD